MGREGGYAEVKLSADSYRITVDTNTETSELRAQNIAFLRAADLTLQSGYDGFIIVGGRGVRERTVGRQKGWNIYESKGEIVIRMVKKSDRDYADANDARLIADQLRPLFQRRRASWFSV
jgi:hypothetical protein